MYALILVTAMFVGESQGAETKTCFYQYSERTYSYIIRVWDVCPMTIEVNY